MTERYVINYTMNKIVFATNNIHKLAEIRDILGDKVEVLSLDDIGFNEEIPETADTLEGNAFQKAEMIHQRTGLDCFADDTGLMVEALDGRPGVYSARYAGEHCSPADNVAKMLREMDGVDNRRARFETVIALIKDGERHSFSGKIEGEILRSPQGEGGFGYDPIFKPLESPVSFASMSEEAKNAISHRGRAVAALADYLKSINFI